MNRWKENSGFVVCSSITPYGMQTVFKYFLGIGGECKRMVREASQPGIRDNLGNDLNAFNPSIMGIRSWVAGERSK